MTSLEECRNVDLHEQDWILRVCLRWQAGATKGLESPGKAGGSRKKRESCSLSGNEDC